tara:strand:- start:294 stop:839 length:546 start_codon:yes stop_codon:yes gene_type:complete
MKTEKVKISKLQENPDNPRFLASDKQKKLEKSIKEFPEMLEARPIVVNKDYTILGGNMRYKSLVASGAKETDVLVVDWSEDKQREFIIKDNVGFGEWNWDLLSNDWQGEKLNEWGLDGFDFDGDDMSESFGEDYIEEISHPINNNHVVVILTMPVEIYKDMDNKINQLINEHKEIICKVQN